MSAMADDGPAKTGRVAGKVALITGGAGGLGSGIARRLRAEGARIVLADLADAEILAAELGGHALSLDVTSPLSWQAALAKVERSIGHLDVLVNNAGIAAFTDIEATDFETYRQIMAVNVDGVFLGCKLALPLLRKGPQAGGSIINISSVSGIIGGHNTAAYNASKGAVRLLTKSVALHCARKNDQIRCNSIHPTFIETAMVQDVIEASADPDKTRQKLARQIPLGRFCSVEDVANMALYLASDESTFVTGAEMVVDGGVTAQ